MNSPANPHFRAGLAALVGRTNAGKSTLINALVDAKIAIVSPKPQTTRHAVQGVVHRPNGQVVFVDTPGFFKTSSSRLVDRLHARARSALAGIDAVVHVADPSRPLGEEDAMVLETLAAVSLPKILCLNKCDLPILRHHEAWLEKSSGYASVIEISALSRHNLDALVSALLPFMPLGPALYEPGDQTNAHRDFRVAEIVREKIYLLTGEEVPYRTAVQLDEIRERTEKQAGKFLHIKALVLVAEERYKGMLIGAGGQKIKAIGVAARTDLEQLLGRKVYLELSVRVDKTLPD
jgi:GTP-binding protein Era